MIPPGAKRDRKDATFENDDTVSVFSVEPTLTAEEIHAGELSFEVEPSLPAATTVAMPTERRLSTSGLIGSPSQLVLERAPPRLRLTDANVCWVRRLYTRSRPAMMSEFQARAHGGEGHWVETRVCREKTWTAMICAPLATPENATPALAPLPAAIPATCVPCQHPGTLSGQLTAEPAPSCCDCPFGQTDTDPKTLLEKHASSRIRPAKNGWVLSTPVS